jgi:hypothetical protein
MNHDISIGELGRRPDSTRNLQQAPNIWMRENGLFTAPPQGRRPTPTWHRPCYFQHDGASLGPNGGEIAAAT